MINDWTIENEARVFTLITALIEKDLKKIYPTIRFTTSDESTASAQFPTVYIHELGSIENNADTEGDYINAVDSTFECVVTVNSTKDDVKKIMKYVLDAFKKMRFQTTSNFIVHTDANMYAAMGRFRKKITESDKLL